jgi:ferric-dicitrate binding protein FerR (iron transport regulator)
MQKTNPFNQKIAVFLDERKSLSEEEQIVEARKIISEIGQVDVDSTTRQVMLQIQKKSFASYFFHQYSRVAAILIVPLLLLSIWFLWNKGPNRQDALAAIQEVSCPLGARTKFVLSDGTKVWLNAESTLKFPVSFVSDHRTLELTGEAYFEVAKDQDKPFTVKARQSRVKVLGTAFNFRSYPGDKEIEVVLTKGRLLLESDFSPSPQNTVLTPGSRVVVDKKEGKMTLSTEPLEKYVAWHQGRLVLDECPIQEVAQKLERWYGIEVIVEDENLLSYRFTSTFEDEPIQQVLCLLELSSPIKITYIPSTYDLQKNRFSRMKVIISKK